MGRKDKKEQEAESKGTDNIGYEGFAHPAFGMVSIGQSSGSTPLVGSAVKHQHYVRLEINEATKHKNKYREHWHPTKTLCEIYLSHAQLAEMLFKTNTTGVPCTIRYATGDKERRPIPPFESPLKQQSEDTAAVLKETLEYAREMTKEVEEILHMKNPKKADKERATFLALKIQQDIESNHSFMLQCADEKIEKNIAYAKVEIESFVGMKLKEMGIEHIQGKDKDIIMLDGRD